MISGNKDFGLEAAAGSVVEDQQHWQLQEVCKKGRSSDLHPRRPTESTSALLQHPPVVHKHMKT